jgi:hypothetical protein
MIKRQIKDLFNCLLAGLCCGCFGALFGFYDCGGLVYFDLRGACTMFLMLFVAGFCACLWEKVKQYNDNAQ